MGFQQKAPTEAFAAFAHAKKTKTRRRAARTEAAAIIGYRQADPCALPVGFVANGSGIFRGDRL